MSEVIRVHEFLQPGGSTELVFVSVGTERVLMGFVNHLDAFEAFVPGRLKCSVGYGARAVGLSDGVVDGAVGKAV